MASSPYVDIIVRMLGGVVMENDKQKEIVILIAEDDDGHAELAIENIREAGVNNKIIRFRDGQEIWDFLTGQSFTKFEHGKSYLLLLDIRMPKLDGVEVLRRVKTDENLKNIPVMILTTTDDPHEIESCYRLGCSCFVTKPVDFTQFSEALKRLGLFIMVMRVPEI